MKRLVLLVAACGHAQPAIAPPAPAPDTIEIVESEPSGTTLDLPNVPDAWKVWPEMIDRAKKTIDLEEFYASSAPAGEEDKLEPSVVALERAIARGVRVRIILDETFHPKYPELPARLEKAGATVKFTSRFSKNGGVQHSKYFVVDASEAYVGSQNFDYRSLDHIQELGVRVRSPVLARALENVFESDWTDKDVEMPVHDALSALFANEPIRVTPLFSPHGSDFHAWDLPEIVRVLDGAKKDIRVQVLTYDAHNRDGTPFTTLDDALRRAASRGVKVRLLVSEWGKKKKLDDLAKVIEIRVLTIPPANKEIPFARVAHAKYMIADDRTAWIGTSNWEGDYFEKSRNIGFLLEGTKPAADLAAFFDRNFTSAYASAF